MGFRPTSDEIRVRDPQRRERVLRYSTAEPGIVAIEVP